MNGLGSTAAGPLDWPVLGTRITTSDTSQATSATV